MTPETSCLAYDEAKSIRNPHETLWRAAAAHCLPQHYASWNNENGAANDYNTQSVQQAARVAYDTTGRRSLPKYKAVIERIATPSGQIWHGLTPSNTDLLKSTAVKLYFDAMTRQLFKYRYHPKARFKASFSECYGNLGVYGNGPVYIGQRKLSPISREPGFRYVSCTMPNMFYLLDDEGVVIQVFRRMWLNARQFKIKFPNDKLPDNVEVELTKAKPDEMRMFEVFHHVSPRGTSDYDEQALDHRRHPWVSRYVSVEGKMFIGEESGYQTMPYPTPRTETVSGNPYGISPAIMALPALGSASLMKKANLIMSNRAASPTWLAHDDGVLNGPVSMKPNAVNYGGLNRDGKELVKELRGGNYEITKDALSDERADIEDSFFVTLFRVLTENPNMTATQVIEISADRGALLGPTMGMIQSELLGPTVEREMSLLTEMGVAPEMPPELIEAQGEYEVTYTSALAKSMYHEEVSGFTRAVEMSIGIANAQGDPSILDHYDFDVAMPEIADNLAVPTRWMADIEAVTKKRADREQQQQEALAAQNAAGLAAAAKTADEIGGE